MRGIGDPRAISAMARVPRRGLRGCAILLPSHFQSGSYSSVAGRGGGGGAFGDSGAGGVTGAGRNGEEQGQGQGDGPGKDELNRWVEQWKRGEPLEGEGNEGSRPQQLAGAGGAARGRGRGFSLGQLNAARDGGESGVQSQSPGRGRGLLSSDHSRAGGGRGAGIFSLPLGSTKFPPLRQDGVDGAKPRDERADESRFDDATGENGEGSLGRGEGDEVKRQDSHLSGEDVKQEAAESRLSAVEKLLAKLGESPAQASVPAHPTLKSISPPNTRVATEESAVKSPSTPQISARGGTILGVSLGRGRGKPGATSTAGVGVPEEKTALPRDIQVTEGAGYDASAPDRVSVQSEIVVQDKQIRRPKERRPKSGPKDAQRSQSPPRMRPEEARARAMAILEQGIEKNVAAEGERRRRDGMEKFADATEFFSDRFTQRGAPSPKASTSRPERQRQGGLSKKGDRSRRQRQDAEEVVVPEAAVAQLTPEQEAELIQIENEEIFKDRLHTLFLTQFEPEFAMEEFGRNPDIEDPPIMSLEDYLQSHKPYFVKEDANLSEHQKWEEAVKASLANAPNLEKLVEAYAGRGRMTARQQIDKLQTIHEKLPQTAPPEVAAFTQRAFMTLQNNPGLNMRQKERLMTNIVNGFRST